MRLSLRIWIGLVSVLLLTSCGSTKKLIDNLLSFEVAKTIPNQTIDGTILPCQIARTLDIPIAELKNVSFSQKEDFPEQNTEVQLIRSAYLKSLSLEILASSEQKNWDFLDSITISIESKAQGKQKLASLSNIKDGLTRLDLAVEDIEISNHIKADGGFTLTSETTGCPPSDTTEFGGNLRISISASPL